MRTAQRHAAVVLAAGGSRRLGLPKQLLTRAGETLVRRAARLVAETNPARVLVTLGAAADRISQELADIPHDPVFNEDWRSGLAGSLRAIAPIVWSFDAVLIVACDQPALERHHLTELLSGAARASARCAATGLGDALGVPAVVPGAWFATWNPSDADHGFRERLRSLDRGTIFGLSAPELGMDIDTRHALDAAVSIGLLDPVAVADFQ